MACFQRPILRARTAALLAAAALGLVAAGPGDAAATRPAPVVVPVPDAPAPLRRLTPRGETSPAAGSRKAGAPSAGSAVAALALVLLLAVGAARLWKTHGPKLPAAAPREAIEVLGRCRIESRQSVYLVRLGSRVLVLGSSGGELSTLSEVTDALEVDLITAQCRSDASRSSPFSRLFDARQKADAADANGPSTEPVRPRWDRTPAERRLAERVRGRAADEEAGRVA